MRNRLITCAAFALVGCLLVAPVSNGFQISVGAALACCILSCTALGYMISVVVDVFFKDIGDESDS
jgi:ABC-type polysaccharide/polyol phosphate export permease